MHHIRTSRGTTLFVPAFYNPLFAQDMRSVPSRWLPGLGAWEVADDRVVAAWEVVRSRFGLHSLCRDCLNDACARVVWLLDTREQASQTISEQAKQFSTRLPQPYRQPPSITREIERHVAPLERTDPSKRAAAEYLGLTWPASREDVTRAFRVAAARAHPDHEGGSEEAILRVLQARQVLSA